MFSTLDYHLVKKQSLVIDKAEVHLLDIKLICDTDLTPWCNCTGIFQQPTGCLTKHDSIKTTCYLRTLDLFVTFSCQPSFSFIYLGYLVYYLQVGTLWRFLVSSRYHGTDKQTTITVWSTLNTPDTASNSKEYMPTASSNVLNSLLASLVSVISFFHVLITLSEKKFALISVLDLLGLKFPWYEVYLVNLSMSVPTVVRVNSGLWVIIPIKFYGTIVFSSGELMRIVAKRNFNLYFKPTKKRTIFNILSKLVICL